MVGRIREENISLFNEVFITFLKNNFDLRGIKNQDNIKTTVVIYSVQLIFLKFSSLLQSFKCRHMTAI